MSLKKVALTTALLASISGMSLNVNAAPSADVTLQGIITATTCDVDVNGSKSTLNVGVYKSGDFVANTKLGSVELPVTLSNCTAAAGEIGKLAIMGTTTSVNANNNIFVANPTDTVGFMVAATNDTTILKNQESVSLNVAAGETSATYSFKVGMASTAVSPAGGTYSAPVTVVYIVN